MEPVVVTAGSVLTLLAVLTAYTGVAWGFGRRFGVALRSEEALALGAVVV